MTYDVIRTVVTVLAAGSVAWKLIAGLVRKSQSARWPVTMGTIETFDIRGVGRRMGRSVQCFCELGYSYSVNGSFQAGRFALGAPRPEAAEDLGKSLKGRTLEIRYNPDKLDDSLPLQSELDGRKIVILEEEESVQVEF